MLKYKKSKTKALSMGKKDVISKEILKNIARDISKHILHIDIKETWKSSIKSLQG